MALGLTQPLTGMSEFQEYFLEGNGGRCVGLTTLPPSCADCLEIWELQPPEPSGPLQACNGIALPLQTMILPNKTKDMCNILGPHSGPLGSVIYTGFSPPPLRTGFIFLLYLHFTQFLSDFPSPTDEFVPVALVCLCSDMHPGDVWFDSQDVRLTFFMLLGSPFRHLRA
jgi:hypothetical protein